MRKTMMLMVAGAMLLTACNSKHDSAEHGETTGTTENTEHSEGVNIPLANLASNMDHVCKMPLTEGAIADTAEYEGKVYGFCATGCKEDFLKDPATHLANK